MQPQDINILYAEDSAILSMAVMNILRHWGYDFKHVTNGADALREYNFGSYQLVLCDYNMGKNMITGLEVLQRLRNAGDDVPFILFTGQSNASEERILKESVEQLGGIFLAKPCTLTELKKTIGNAIAPKKPDSTPRVDSLNL